MELKDFVSDTLTQIIEGVKAARNAAGESDALVAPHIDPLQSHLEEHGMVPAGDRVAQIVNFNVALTVTEGSGTKGGIGVVAGAINLGSAGQSRSSNSTVSRVQFSVPVALPTNG